MDHRLFANAAFSSWLVLPLLFVRFSLTWSARLAPMLLCLFYGPFSAHAQSEEAACQKHYKSSDFLQAGDCYKNLLGTLRTRKRDDFRDLLEDRYLRNGAICYAKAAEQPAHQASKAVLQNRAADLLMESFRSGTCKASGRCESNRNLADQLLRKIKAAPLAVLTGNEEARITVTGVEYSRQALGQFSESVRPGLYTVEVLFPPSNKKVQSVEIKPGLGKTVNVSADKINILEKNIVIANQTPPIVIAGYVVGGIVLAAAIPMIVYAPLEQGRLNGILSDPKTAKTITDEQYNNEFNTASTILTVGVIAAAVGVVVLGAAAIVHTLSQSSQSETLRPLPGLSTLPPTDSFPLGRSDPNAPTLLLSPVTSP